MCLLSIIYSRISNFSSFIFCVWTFFLILFYIIFIIWKIGLFIFNLVFSWTSYTAWKLTTTTWAFFNMRWNNFIFFEITLIFYFTLFIISYFIIYILIIKANFLNLFCFFTIIFIIYFPFLDLFNNFSIFITKFSCFIDSIHLRLLILSFMFFLMYAW